MTARRMDRAQLAVGHAMRQSGRLLDRVEPVRVDPDSDHTGRHPCQRGSHSATTSADIVGVHRLREDEVGVGVEPPTELLAVVVQVALDGIPAAPTQRVLPGCGSRPKRSSSSEALR